MAEVLNNDIRLTERYKSHLLFDDASAVYFLLHVQSDLQIFVVGYPI